MINLKLECSSVDVKSLSPSFDAIPHCVIKPATYRRRKSSKQLFLHAFFKSKSRLFQQEESSSRIYLPWGSGHLASMDCSWMHLEHSHLINNHVSVVIKCTARTPESLPAAQHSTDRLPCTPTVPLFLMANLKGGAFFLGFVFGLAIFQNGAWASSFTLINKCEYTVWPGILAGAGTQPLSTTGFELLAGESVTVEAPAGWSGRLWGRTLCTFDAQGNGNCATGDCGSSLQCNGKNAAPPATLAEFTLGHGDGVADFYDVSLVDGYNLPMVVAAKGGNGTCSATGCVTDLNLSCPKELQVNSGVACKSACEAFGDPEYCCSGAFATPNTCKPSSYSQLFKAACPRAYSYAYDDGSSTFTCTGADYVITFCPDFNRQKNSKDSPDSTVSNSNVWALSTAAGTNQAGRANRIGDLSFVSLYLGLFSLSLLAYYAYPCHLGFDTALKP